MLVAKEEVIDGKTCKVTLDPTGCYTKRKITYDDLINVTGILMAWAWDAVQTDDAITVMQDFYQFSCTEMKGGRVSEDGTYTYPRDPALHPVASITSDTAEVFVYEYAIVAIRQGEKTFVTRMD